MSIIIKPENVITTLTTTDASPHAIRSVDTGGLSGRGIYLFKADVVGTDTSYAQMYGGTLSAVFKVDVSGTLSLLGYSVIHSEIVSTPYEASFDAFGTTMRLLVNSQGGNASWKASTSYLYCGG